ncbi:FAD-dependent oxidoreductase [Noviherbaspirillum sp.]|jgi:glycine/D-amino acid oxidase-like deaminating enzyme/nitrite reductase/ring-hydroxylating ferredoxin subunit|uniref:FAD-dependent oxidoreductase n=1 Tax=Noviherbaspirillum sp. TaxID=1926288 RepID=UPI0025F417EC|nr:FAD-dependent oxidoreductase [Noviherbaspirillum sp.]
MNTEDDDFGARVPPRASIWQTSADATVFPALNSDLEVNVLIVGGGITGISTAALLAQSGVSVAVLEAARIGYGTTGHSTGNLYAMVDCGLHKLASKWGEDKMLQVVESRRAAVNLVEKNVRDYALKCDFSRQPWVLYSMDASGDSDGEIDREYQAALKAGLDARVTNDLPLPYSIDKALVVSHQAQFHPLKYVRQLAAAIGSAQCRIFEKTPVLDIEGDAGIVKTAQHTIKAQHIVLATHTPKGFNTIQTELGPYREYAVAAPLTGHPLAGGIFWNVGAEKYSTRLVGMNGKPYVLMIGEVHKTGQKSDPEAAYRKLEAVLQARFDIDGAEFRWSAQQYRPADGLPYIGQAIGSDRLLIASGFSADGLTYGTMAAMMLADAIASKTNPWRELYTPRRFTPLKSAGAFLKENLNVAGYYVKDYMTSAAVTRFTDVPRGEGRIVDIAGDKLAVYRDDAYQLHVLSPVCTHLKCVVHWNQAEHSWDCPCHGSRFAVDGTVLEGPALTPLQRRIMPPGMETDLESSSG